jgi:ketosteroid isomerase-like protein
MAAMSSKKAGPRAADADKRVAKVIRRYYARLEDPTEGEESVTALLDADIRIVEHPNMLSPKGSVRSRAELIDGLINGRALLRAQSYHVHEILVHGERAAVRLTWRAILDADAGKVGAGAELVAHSAVFLTVRDGVIVEQESFDCYAPMGD